MQPFVTGVVTGGGRTAPGVLRRRAEPRSAHRVPCEVRILDAATGVRRVLLGRVVNLSASGAAVEVGQPLARGTAVEAFMIPAADAPRRLSGEVRHVRQVLTGTFELGIEVTSPPD